MKKNCDFNKSITDNWATPKVLYDFFMSNGYKDPCPYESKINGLNINYKKSKLFINPPFSQLARWCDYAIEQFNLGNNVVLLMPARTDTIYFHKLLKLEPMITFIKGRLRFNDGKKCAPFPTILLWLTHTSFKLPIYCSIIITDRVILL